MAAMVAGFLRDSASSPGERQRPHQPPQHLARLLETATAGMTQTTGEEWVLFALVAARLAPEARASPVGARFLSAVVLDLPGRLEMLQPAQLVSGSQVTKHKGSHLTDHFFNLSRLVTSP